MVGAHDPALDERPEAINASGVDGASDVFLLGVVDRFMVKLRREAAIRRIVIRSEQGDLADTLLDEALEGGNVGVLDHLRRDLALPGDSTDDGELAGGSASTLALPHPATDAPTVTVLSLSTDICLIDFHDPGELLEFVVLHRRSDAMAHIPCGSVGARTDGPMDLEGAHSLLGLAHEVDDLKPGSEPEGQPQRTSIFTRERGFLGGLYRGRLIESSVRLIRHSRLARAVGEASLIGFDRESLEQLLELLDCQTGIPDDTGHRIRVHRIGTRDGEKAHAVGHDDMLALPDDAEPCLLQGLHRLKMVDARKLRHRQVGISTSRTSAPRSESLTAARYS